MTIKAYAYYSTDTGLIENAIVIDDAIAPTLAWPDGYAIVPMPDEPLIGEWSTCGIGWSYVNGAFVEPEKQPQPISTGTQDL